MARWEDRRGRTETLERKAGEGIQKDWEPRGNQQHSDEPKPGASQKGCSNTPSANPPGHVTCNDSRSDHEEYYRAKNGKYSPHSVILHIRRRVVGQPVCMVRNEVPGDRSGSGALLCHATVVLA